MPRVKILPLLACAVLAWPSGWAYAQGYGPDSPLPPGAKAEVLPLQGQAYELKAKVLDLVGLSSGIQGALEALDAKVSDKEIVISLAADVLFDFDKHQLRPEAAEALAKVTEVLKAMPEAAVRIEGHTDAKGSERYNQRLSERRAKTVRDWIVTSGGVPAARLATVGLGETQPVAPNNKPDGADDPDGRQQNRRVEIRVLKP